MTLHARRAVAARLAAAGVPTPEVDARWLVRELGADPVALEAALLRRCRREPLQLILGSVGFRHREVAVEAGVFVPRPETEVLAGLAIERVPDRAVVVEPCSGTGAVAAAIASESRAARVVATDTSAAAVALARRNCADLPHVEVLRGHLLEPLDPALRGRVDVLVSNPPYLAERELAATEPEVREHDPVRALVAGPTGHEVSDMLIAAAREWLRPGGWLLLEVDATRAAAAAQRMAAARLVGAQALEDLTGRPRFAVARRPHHEGRRQ